MQVGNAFENNKTRKELELIASDPDDTHAFTVTNYTALDGLLSKLQQSIIHMEGEGPSVVPSASGRRPSPVCQPQPCPTSIWLSRQLLSPLSASAILSKKVTISPALIASPELPEPLMRSLSAGEKMTGTWTPLSGAHR